MMGMDEDDIDELESEETKVAAKAAYKSIFGGMNADDTAQRDQ